MCKRILAVLLALTALFLTTACEEAVQIEYSSERKLYSEGYGGFSFYADMLYTASERAVYYFDEAISLEERVACMKATEEILAMAGATNLPEICIYSPEQLADTFIDGVALYTCVQEWESPDYAARLLMAAYGKYINYGAAYGYADYICRQLGYELTSNNTYDSVLHGAEAVYDLTLPCFDAAIAGKDGREKAKAAAIGFISDCIETYGEAETQRLICCSGDEALLEQFNNALALYYADCGIEHQLTDILYAYGGSTYSYIALTNEAIFLVEKTWQDINAENNPAIYKDFMRSNYADIRKFIETNSQQMRDYQTLFDVFPDEPVSVIFSNASHGSAYSFYQASANTIYLKNVDSLMHEYIHSLSVDLARSEDWAIEGFARYFSYKYDYYGIAFLNADYNSPGNSRNTLYVREYLERIGRPIDMAIDFAEIEAIAIYSRGAYQPNGSYAAGSSFVGYLVASYGEQAVIDYVLQRVEESHIEELTLVEHIAAWRQQIEEEYSDYSKLK